MAYEQFLNKLCRVSTPIYGRIEVPLKIDNFDPPQNVFIRMYSVVSVTKIKKYEYGIYEIYVISPAGYLVSFITSEKFSIEEFLIPVL